MPLYGEQLFSSELYIEGTAVEFRAYIKLLYEAYKQKPAASLPSSDKALAYFAGFGSNVRKFLTVKQAVLREFILCSDGRLYHPLLCKVAIKAFEKHSRSILKREGDRKRLQNWRSRSREEHPSEEVSRDETRFSSVSETTIVAGERRREGEEKEDSHPSDGPSEAGQGMDGLSGGGKPPPGARDILWQQGLPILAHLTGKPAGKCRSFLGRLLSLAGDDCAMVMMKLYEAQSMHPLAEAEAWLMRACDTKGKRPAARKSRMAWMHDDPQFAALVGRAPPAAAKTASPDLNIIDASEWEEAR
ncbi:hypothetical protein [Acidisoma sp. 7E03]